MDDYCIIQITSNATRHMMRPPTHSNALRYVVKHRLRSDLKTGRVMFAALKQFEASCTNRWTVMGDDDTLFFDIGIARFLYERRSERTKPVAYGNMYDVHVQNSWFTGGSGLLLSPEITKRILRANNTLPWQKHALWCACADVPLAHAIRGVGGRLIHKPNHFLDSCLYCKTHPLRSHITACHGVSMFRNRNPHTDTKKGRDESLVEFNMTSPSSSYHTRQELYEFCNNDRLSGVVNAPLFALKGIQKQQT
jgi:hypothetical protein